MVTEFEFPDVGEGVTEGTLVKWLVSEGDEVEEDESLAEVETDKAVVEVPSPVHGTVLELRAEEGDTIYVGDVIVTIGDEGEEAGGEPEEEPEDAEDEEIEEEEDSGGSTSVVGELEDADAEPAEEETEGEEEPEESGETGKEAGTGGKVLAAPSTRKLAREQGVDINRLEGSGPGGRVTKEDVKAAAGGETVEEASETASAPAPGTTFGSSGRRFEPEDRDFEKWGEVEKEELSPTRKSIAKRMERSAYTAPHVTATDDADVTELVKVRKKEKENAEEQGVYLTFLPFVVKAIISALRDHPRLNASLDEKTGELVKKEYYNIGVAVATDDGLLVPNVKNADQKSILQIAGEIEELADKARNRELSLEQMKGGTFTITNWGSIGGKYGTPILNYPEVGILGTGVIEDKPMMVDGELQVRKVMPLSLSFDHRVVDGAYAAQFMNELVTHLEDPDLLMMD